MPLTNMANITPRMWRFLDVQASAKMSSRVSLPFQSILASFSKACPNRSWRLEIESARFANPFLRKKYNYKTMISDSSTGNVCVGYAEGHLMYATIWKAFAESYERFIFLTEDLSATTTNGYAAHTDIHTACLNALYELIERDAVLTAWADRCVPLARLSPVDFAIPIKMLRRYGYAVNIFQIGLRHTTNPCCSVIFAVIRPICQSLLWRHVAPNAFEGRLCGFGCSFSMQHAVWKAYREAVINAWAIILNQKILDQDRNVFISANDLHFHYYLRKENVEAFSHMEDTGLPITRLSTRQNNDTVKVCEIDAIETYLRANHIDITWDILCEPSERGPFYVVRARSPHFKILRFGNDKQLTSNTNPWLHPIA